MISLLQKVSLAATACSLLVSSVSADTARIDFPRLGELKTRASSEIASSSWSIGCETLDRGFAVYQNFRDHLGPLGAKSVRLQSGWARCEREPGVYNWAWLDEIVDDAIAQGVHPWLQLSYGNPLYAGGGDSGLGGGIPRSDEALAAWDRWARAVVTRYGDRVSAWEIWNEPDLKRRNDSSVETYTKLFIRTATMIREIQPHGKIYALGLAGKLDYASAFLERLKQEGLLSLVDVITIHGYPRNPDDLTNIDRLNEIIASHGHPIKVHQGETGAPSHHQDTAALRDISWTENLQAKWNIRRMLAHHARDIPFNLFTLADNHYRRNDPQSGLTMGTNHKGLIQTNTDHTVARAKVTYHAASRVFSIFDDTLRPLAGIPSKHTSLRELAVDHYQRTEDGARLVAIWFNDAPPSEANGVTRINLSLEKTNFTEPVWVDLLSGAVHAFPEGAWMQTEEEAAFVGLPVYDSPVLIAEKALLQIRPASN
jgi:Beta-glucosidase/6-phospho-beta-glucosidase/beta-galactosidase